MGIKEARERSEVEGGLKKRRAQHLRATIRYYSLERWTPERLVDKAGRLAVRLVALNTVLRQKTGVWMLAPALLSALEQLMVRNARSKRPPRSRARTDSASPPPPTKP
ncbi:MAG: hypothetical protein A2Y74_07000 [Actinobacteria bacterium RBG_13_63_9]|nr:MAG: hypothetical protein A2Y74_07000 [Actinobacteria bacterium RBG_13_63_9]